MDVYNFKTMLIRIAVLLNSILAAGQIQAQSMEQYQGDKVRCLILKQGNVCNKLAHWAEDRKGSVDGPMYRALACDDGDGASCETLGERAGETSGSKMPVYFIRGCDLANPASCLSLVKAAQTARTIQQPMATELVDRVHAALAKLCGPTKQEAFCPQLREADQGLLRFGNPNFKSCKYETIAFSESGQLSAPRFIPVLPAASGPECKSACEAATRIAGLSEGATGAATLCFFADKLVPPITWQSGHPAGSCDSTPVRKTGERENYFRPCYCMGNFQTAMNEQLIPLGILAQPEFEAVKIGSDVDRARCGVTFEFIPPLPDGANCPERIAKAKMIGAKFLPPDNFDAEYQTLHCAKAAHP